MSREWVEPLSRLSGLGLGSLFLPLDTNKIGVKYLLVLAPAERGAEQSRDDPDDLKSSKIQDRDL